MADIAIRAEGIAKQYRIGQLLASYDTLREHLTRLFRGRAHRNDARTIWALKDVSFEVENGEVVGIIGRNGAGKTSLLKILSRITEPTRGRAVLYGRVGSLLEVGTGFHPELTGRENILLNGAVLGMRRAETLKKFDEIVEFAGVSKFIDTPVKRYSSGMYVRLAFSVAAHLEPEILLVDEVLAVGDAEFQRRCLGKMESIGRSGRTVLFVSHSMTTVARLCERVILLDSGVLVEDGPAARVVARYLSAEYGSSARRSWALDEAPGNDFARIRSMRVVTPELETAETVDIREAVGIELSFDVLRAERPIVPMLAVHNDQGVYLFNALDPDPAWEEVPELGSYTATAWIPPNLLNEGTVIVSGFVNSLSPGKIEKHAAATDAVSFQVVDSGSGLSAKGRLAQRWGGAVLPLLQWTVPRRTAADRERTLG